MDDAVKLLVGKQGCHSFAVGQIEFVKAEIPGCQQIQARLLQVDIVVVVEIVDTDNLMPCV
ncbi:hypothetical protein D3C86_2235420 [compost metagenome]